MYKNACTFSTLLQYKTQIYDKLLINIEFRACIYTGILRKGGSSNKRTRIRILWLSNTKNYTHCSRRSGGRGGEGRPQKLYSLYKPTTVGGRIHVNICIYVKKHSRKKSEADTHRRVLYIMNYIDVYANIRFLYAQDISKENPSMKWRRLI